MASDNKPINCSKPDTKESKSLLVNLPSCQPSDKQGTNACRPCAPTELVRNGGFEQEGVFSTFADWDEFSTEIRISDILVSYEGNLAAAFNALPTTDIQTKSARLFQNITVNPGCFLTLSFANNFDDAGTDFEELNLRARVYYGPTQTNLINVEIKYNSDIQAGTGYVFHQRTTDKPVPLNVSTVTLEFEVIIVDRGTAQSFTQLFLDGVSLRAA